MSSRRRDTKTELLNLEIEEVGTICFVRSRVARNLNIRIKPFAGVRVSVPASMSFTQAQALVRGKHAWIVKHLQRVREYERSAHLYDGTRELRTRGHRFDIRAEARKDIVSERSGDWVAVRYPEEMELHSSAVQSAIRHTLVAVCRSEAKAFLPSRLADLAARYGFSFNRVFIKNHKSRWGSCSSANNINLSLHLMRLPDAIIDYVLLHELVHTEIKNHSREFWSRLTLVCPDVEKRRAKLRQLERNLPR